MVTQFQGSRRNNRKVVRKTCTFWLWSKSSTQQIHRSCRWVVEHSSEFNQCHWNWPSLNRASEWYSNSSRLNQQLSRSNRQCLWLQRVLLTASQLISKCLRGLPDIISASFFRNTQQILTILALRYDAPVATWNTPLPIPFSHETKIL